MITYGFFNSVNGDRTYNADDMANYFEGIVTDGVFAAVGQALKVTPNTGMKIKVGAGKAIIFNKYVNVTATENLTLTAADATYNRYDAIVLKCNLSTRQITLEVKEGEEAQTPVKPTIERSAYIKEMCLAYVYIAAGSTSVVTSNIEDKRSDYGVCGYVQPLVGTTIHTYKQKATPSVATDRVTIGIAEFNSEVDTLLVYENGLLLNETDEYIVGGTGFYAFVDLVVPLPAGNTLTFIVFKAEAVQ